MQGLSRTHTKRAGRTHSRWTSVADALEPRRLLAGSTLDPSFGTGGIARAYPSGGLHEFPVQVIRQADGKSLTAGIAAADTERSVIVLFRCNADGFVDTTFTPTGVRILSSFDSTGIRWIRQRSGGGYEAIIWRGATYYSARLLNTGALDPTWDTDGLVELQGWDSSPALDVTMDASGRVLRTVQVGSGTASVKLQRFNVNGTPDTTFGPNGVLTDSAAAGWTSHRIVVQSTGRILVLARPSAQSRAASVLAYDDRGARAAGFGTNGIADAGFSLPVSGNVDLKSLLVQSNGSVIVAGVERTTSSTPDFGYAVFKRLTATGQRDASYGDAGTGVARRYGPGSSITGIAGCSLDPFDRLVISSGSLARLTTAGAYDDTFDYDSVVSLPLTSDLVSCTPGPLAFEPDGRVLFATESQRDYSERLSGNISLQRLTITGGADATFRSGKPTSVGIGGLTTLRAQRSVMLADGATLIVGYTGPTLGLAAARITAGGASNVEDLPIYGFATEGVVTDAVPRSDGNGAFVACAFTMRTASSAVERSGIYKLRADGSPESAFGSGTLLVIDDGSSPGQRTQVIHLASDPSTGGLFVLLDRTLSTGAHQYLVHRYSADGVRDTTFNGGSGQLEVPLVNGAAWARRIVVSTAASLVAVVGETADRAVRLFRFGLNGSPIAGGAVANAGAAPPVAGSIIDAVVSQTGSALYLLRHGSYLSGSTRIYATYVIAVDVATAAFSAAFGTQGIASLVGPTAEIPAALAIDASQRVVLAGTTSTSTTTRPYARRFTFDGRNDIGFATNGFVSIDVPKEFEMGSVDASAVAVGIGLGGGIQLSGNGGTAAGQNPITLRFRPDAAEAPKVVALAQQADLVARSPHLRLTFDQAVGHSFSAADVELANLTTGRTLAASELSVTAMPGSTEFQIRTPGFPGGRLPNGNYRLRIAASSVTSAPPYSLPMSADYAGTFRVLAGDANDDGRANFDDLLIVAANYNQSGRAYATGDFNYDGACNFDDLLTLAASYNVSLVTGPAPIGGPTGIGGDEDGDDASPGNAADVLS